MVNWIKVGGKIGKKYSDDLLKIVKRSPRKIETLSDDVIRTASKSKTALRSGAETLSEQGVKKGALLSRVKPSTVVKAGALTGIGVAGIAGFDPKFRGSVGNAISDFAAANRERAVSDRVKSETTFIEEYLNSGGSASDLPSVLGSDGTQESGGATFGDTLNSPYGFLGAVAIAGLGIWAFTKIKKKK